MKNLHNEQSFKSIYDQIVGFSHKCDIDIKQRRKRSQTQTVPTRFANSIITSTVGHRDDDDNDEHRYRTTIYYPLIDTILIELNDRFSSSILNLIIGLSALHPENGNFLDFQSLHQLGDHLNCVLNQLQNELNVIKPIIKDDKLKSTTTLFMKLKLHKNTFPTAISMITGALTIFVSSTTCERSFSKMKLIRHYTRSHTRLSDMCLLAVEKILK